MSEFFSRKFKLGTRTVSLIDLIDSDYLESLKSKYPSTSEKDFWVSLRELTRYLYLTSFAPHGLFFPGTKLMDDLWHSLITETKVYQSFCHNLRPGTFLHHSGIKYKDYTDEIGANQIHVEESSWLSSYLNAFGPIDVDAFECLLMAKAIAKNMGLSLDQLNSYSVLLKELSVDEGASNENDLAEIADLLDSDRNILKNAMIQVLSDSNLPENNPKLLTPIELENLYGISTALAFCTAQHLAAVERLFGLKDWQQKKSNLWADISQARTLVGLATTHLAKPGGSPLVAIEVQQGYELSGTSMWVCGFEIFSKLIVGFETENNIVFALIDFPYFQTADLEILVHDMIGLNGMGTVNLTFKKFFIPSDSIISIRAKSGDTAPAPRQTRYVIPELGLAKRALAEVKKIIAGSGSPKHKLIQASFPLLEARIFSLEDLRSKGTSISELIPLKDEILRDSVRLLAVASGANAMLKKSLASRFQNEVLFLENPVQPAAAIESRIRRICKGSNEF